LHTGVQSVLLQLLHTSLIDFFPLLFVNRVCRAGDSILPADIMSPQPKLPDAHLAHLDSMLSRKFGKEIANYFSGMGAPFANNYVHIYLSY
jgi:hypothetical protein